MPSLRQSLFWIYIHTEAKFSVLSNLPVELWRLPNQREKQDILTVNWYEFHQIYTLTFLVNSIDDKEPKFPLVLSFFFLSPRWFLVNDFDFIINKCWEKSLYSNSPSIIINLNKTPTPASWFLLKQNDPDLLRLIVARTIQNKIFMPPFTNFVLAPLGVTPPIIKPPLFVGTPLKLDPTSSTRVQKGHKLLFRSYATAVDF